MAAARQEVVTATQQMGAQLAASQGETVAAKERLAAQARERAAEKEELARLVRVESRVMM